MSTILQRILETKRDEIAALRAREGIRELRARAADAPFPPSFFDALAASPEPRLIAEIKKASPSKGVIREDFDPVSIARAYEAGGAAALSILTDHEYFQGDISFIPAVKDVVGLPALRKDFIIDDAQIFEARGAGASALLLIAAALEPSRLSDLYHMSRECGLDVLVEVHNAEDVARLKESAIPARIVGINNRDLRTFGVDLAVTERIIPILGGPPVIVSESGIFTPAHVERVVRAGARAILVGESLMRQADVEGAVRELLRSPGEPET